MAVVKLYRWLIILKRRQCELLNIWAITIKRWKFSSLESPPLPHCMRIQLVASLVGTISLDVTLATVLNESRSKQQNKKTLKTQANNIRGFMLVLSGSADYFGSVTFVYRRVYSRTTLISSPLNARDSRARHIRPQDHLVKAASL